MKLLFTLVILAIGFGVSQVFLQGEDAKGHSQTAQLQNTQTPVTETPTIEVPIIEPEHEQITQPQLKEPPVTQASDREVTDDSFYYLLHPDRKDRQENPDTEEAKN